MNSSFPKEYFHRIRRLLAKLWLKMNSRLTIIGITGSYGKTNTARAIAQVLSEKYKVLQTDLNLDTNYNLPLTLLKLRPSHEFLVLELGVDHRGEMDSHLSLVRPKIAVLTGINPTHSDPELLGSLAGIINEKSKLLEALPKNGLSVLNWDDEYVRKMTERTNARVIRYGTEKKSCDFWAEDIKVDFSGTAFVIGMRENSETKLVRVKTGLVGRHFVSACLAAAVIGIEQGLNWEQIKNGLEKLTPLWGRLSIQEGPKESILINDALRANPASTLAGLRTLADLPVKGRKIAVLGEMGELGELAESEHRQIGKEAGKMSIDYLIAIGPLQKFTAEEAVKAGMGKERVFWAENVNQAAGILDNILQKNDLLYLKGSLLRHLERVLLLLEGKKVECQLVSCHHYGQCQTCVKIGLQKR